MYQTHPLKEPQTLQLIRSGVQQHTITQTRKRLRYKISEHRRQKITEHYTALLSLHWPRLANTGLAAGHFQPFLTFEPFLAFPAFFGLTDLTLTFLAFTEFLTRQGQNLGHWLGLWPWPGNGHF